MYLPSFKSYFRDTERHVLLVGLESKQGDGKTIREWTIFPNMAMDALVTLMK